MVISLRMKKINVKKIFLLIFALLLTISLLDYFFDRYTLQSPVIIKFQSPVIKRTPSGHQSFNPRKRGSAGQSAAGGPTLSNTRSKASNSPSNKRKDKKNTKIYPKKINAPLEAIYVYFGDDVVAYAVALAESGLNCEKVSRTNDYGLFQINKVHLWRFKKQGLDPFNCWDNAKVAMQIQEEQGWKPWSAYKNGSYKKHLNSAKKLVKSLEKEI